MKECERVFSENLKVTSEESSYLAESTRLQVQSRVWFEHRKGQLVASKFRAICHTSVTKPSRSLVAQILQFSPMPKSAALSWGIEQEKTAREQYLAMQAKQHTSFKIEVTGLCVNPQLSPLRCVTQWPHQLQLLWSRCSWNLVLIVCNTLLQSKYCTCCPPKMDTYFLSSMTTIIRYRESWESYCDEDAILFAGPHMVSILSKSFMTPPFYHHLCQTRVFLFK